MKHLVLVGEINEEMVAKTINHFNETEAIEGKYFVYACTAGGEVDSAFAIYDIFNLIRSQGYQVDLTLAGACYSAGTLILCGATIVKSLPNTQLLIHYGTEVNSTDDEKRQNDEMTKKYINILDRRLTVSPRTIKAWLKREKYFSPEQALKVGLIDTVIGK